ncbi:hypothetical protein ECC02_005285 [Trypanosoma cruzi]|uniref:Uncharacterized protein n=1 Tax=Trypanosoma cruzi TaxID=5693 RepID=A0A7J6Y4X8_TRYCR|nr:hypothetical protein ECC02_005285 [Trypanosoma cruzi]
MVLATFATAAEKFFVKKHVWALNGDQLKLDDTEMCSRLLEGRVCRFYAVPFLCVSCCDFPLLLFSTLFMLRRSRLWRLGNYRQHSDKERDRIAQERQRRILYDHAGNVKLSGLLFLFWEEFRLPILCVAGGIVFLIGYNKLIYYLSAQEFAHEKSIDQQSEANARLSGKLKGDRYLVKPRRQLDDPDFLNIPSYAGKGVYSSKLFDDDSASTDPLFSEKRRN